MKNLFHMISDIYHQPGIRLIQQENLFNLELHILHV